MSRSSARIASKLPTKIDGDYEDAPVLKQMPEKKSTIMSDAMAASTSRRTMITTSESSGEEYHSMDEEGEVLPTPRKKLFLASRSAKAGDTKKEEEFAPSDDIFFARSKLDAVLAHITHGEQEGAGDDYDSDCEISLPSKSPRRTRPRK